MSSKTNPIGWVWLGAIVLLATAYVWWLSLAALRISSGG